METNNNIKKYLFNNKFSSYKSEQVRRIRRLHKTFKMDIPVDSILAIKYVSQKKGKCTVVLNDGSIRKYKLHSFTEKMKRYLPSNSSCYEDYLAKKQHIQKELCSQLLFRIGVGDFTKFGM